MKIYCPHCNQGYDVPEKYIGQKAECEKCGVKFIIRTKANYENLINLFFNEIYYRLNYSYHNPGTVQQCRTWVTDFALYYKDVFLINLVRSKPFINTFYFINDNFFYIITRQRNYKQALEESDIIPFYLYCSERCKIKSHKKINNQYFFVKSRFTKKLYPAQRIINCNCYLKRLTKRQAQDYNPLKKIPKDFVLGRNNFKKNNLQKEIIKNYSFLKNYKIKLDKNYISIPQIKHNEKQLIVWENELKKAKTKKHINECQETINSINEYLSKYQ